MATIDQNKYMQILAAGQRKGLTPEQIAAQANKLGMSTPTAPTPIDTAPTNKVIAP